MTFRRGRDETATDPRATDGRHYYAVCRSASFVGLFYLIFVLLILQGCGGGDGGGGSRGTYPNPPRDTFDPMIGVRRASAFVEWLRDNYRRGHIGEFGVPGDDPRWLEGMDNLLTYLQEQCIPMAYWAAGHQWRDDYPLLVEPGPDGEGQAQWEVLSNYVGQGDCSVYGPPP